MIDRMTRRLAPLAVVLGICLAASTAARADLVIDPPNDLRQFHAGDPNSYAGPANPALDVLSAHVIYDVPQGTLTLTATMAGPLSGLIDPSTGANLGSYSWGINHGYATNNFDAIGLPGVVFDTVLTLNPNGTGSYRGSAAPAGSVIISGDTITAVLTTSFLAPPPPPANATGPLLPVEQWSYDLWPRSSVRVDGTPLGFGNSQIADFAPDATTFPASAVPEPSSLALLGLGIAGAGLLARRNRSAIRRHLTDELH
jgi:hypothetical protein